MKRFFILLFVLLMLCSFGCSAGQWLMTTLDGDWRELHFNIDNITEILVTAPDKSEALLISDPAEIESILKNAKQVSFQSGNYTPFDGTYTVRVYENDLLVACLHPEEPHLYNPAFGKVLSRLMKRLKNGDYNCYACRISVPKGVHYDDAAEYLNKCGYDTRYFNSNNPYPYLILSYSACEEDMMRYSETELTKHCALGTFEPDTNLAVFTEELRREGYVKSYSTVSEKERRYVHGELEFIKRGIYIYLTKYLTEEEITTLQARAEKASLEWTYLYTGFYSEACEDTLLLSESPIDESQLAAIETGLSVLVHS